RQADPQAFGGAERPGAAVAAGLQGLCVRQADLRRHRDPGSDSRHRRGGRSGLDAVESAQRLHGGCPAAQRTDRLPMIRAVLGGVLALTAAALAAAAPAQTLAPNELGRVMILEYHKIDYPEERWTRTPENFRRDLETLYTRGYRLLALNDLLDGRINVPAGTTPVVLTFDDSSPGQFRYVARDGQLEIDPKSGIGVLEAFIRERPDFGRAATFYVLPGASRPNKLFNQDEYAGKKLQFLVAHGYEL